VNCGPSRSDGDSGEETGTGGGMVTSASLRGTIPGKDWLLVVGEIGAGGGALNVAELPPVSDGTVGVGAARNGEGGGAS